MSAFVTKSPGITAMPWGKWKNRQFGEIPPDYLRWVLRDADMVSDDLRRAIEEHLSLPVGSTQKTEAPAEKPKAADWHTESELLRKDREIERLRQELAFAEEREFGLKKKLRETAATAAALPTMTDAGRFRVILRQWFGAMSRQFHPDMGGTAEKQSIVNILYRDLMKRLEDQ